MRYIINSSLLPGNSLVYYIGNGTVFAVIDVA